MPAPARSLPCPQPCTLQDSRSTAASPPESYPALKQDLPDSSLRSSEQSPHQEEPVSAITPHPPAPRHRSAVSSVFPAKPSKPRLFQHLQQIFSIAALGDLCRQSLQ